MQGSFTVGPGMSPQFDFIPLKLCRVGTQHTPENSENQKFLPVAILKTKSAIFDLSCACSDDGRCELLRQIL